MEKPKETQYYKAYIQGYRDGVRDAISGKNLENIETDLTKLPIEAMEISTRARNCLIHAGYETVADVAALDDYAVFTMRNLGPKSAAEIAHWLDTHGICSSAWVQYL